MTIVAMPESCQSPALRGDQRPGAEQKPPFGEAMGIGNHSPSTVKDPGSNRPRSSKNSLHPADDAVVEVTGNGRPMVPGVIREKRVEAGVVEVQDEGSIPSTSSSTF